MFHTLGDQLGEDLPIGTATLPKILSSVPENPITGIPQLKCPPGTMRTAATGAGPLCEKVEDVYARYAKDKDTEVSWTPYVILGAIGLVLVTAAMGGRR